MCSQCQWTIEPALRSSQCSRLFLAITDILNRWARQRPLIIPLRVTLLVPPPHQCHFFAQRRVHGTGRILSESHRRRLVLHPKTLLLRRHPLIHSSHVAQIQPPDHLPRHKLAPRTALANGANLAPPLPPPRTPPQPPPAMQQHQTTAHASPIQKAHSAIHKRPVQSRLPHQALPPTIPRTNRAITTAAPCMRVLAQLLPVACVAIHLAPALPLQALPTAPQNCLQVLHLDR